MINKPITIEGGNNTIIRSCGDQPVITVQGDGVVLKNLKIEQCSKTSDTAAIYATGKNHHLENMQIQSTHYGIKLNQASGTVIEKGSILKIKISWGVIGVYTLVYLAFALTVASWNLERRKFQ
ncbi:hypothetical protein [Bacillus songklensis]|uniref:hypothetical protein n=1 Tax=Bacillus songklensis TaxID=1069116 RepID=UPI00366D86D2